MARRTPRLTPWQAGLAGCILLSTGTAVADTAGLPLPPANGPIRIDGSGGRQVVVRYTGPLGAFDARALFEQADGRLEAVETGYDTILLRTTPGIVCWIKTGGDRPMVILDGPADADGAEGAEGTANVPDGTGPDDDEVRLRLLEAHLLTLNGNHGAARAVLDPLHRKRPDSPAVLGALADLETRSGRWIRGIALYQEASRLDPASELWRTAAARIERDHASVVREDVEWRHVRSAETMALSQTTADLQVSQAFRFAATFETVFLEAPTVRRPDGSVSTDVNAFGRRGEVAVRYDTDGGSTVSGLVFLGADTPGAGAEWEHRDDFGTTTVKGAWRRPDWLYAEQILSDGARDRLSIGRSLVAGAIRAQATVGGNRYRIAGDAVARTLTVDAQVRAVPIADLPFLSLAYMLGTEYVGSVDTRTSRDGTTFQPLPVSDREVHAGTVNLDFAGGEEGDWSWSLGGYGGYGVDRLGDAGPLAGFTATGRSGSWSYQLRTSYVGQISRNGETSMSIGGYASMRF